MYSSTPTVISGVEQALVLHIFCVECSQNRKIVCHFEWSKIIANLKVLKGSVPLAPNI